MALERDHTAERPPRSESNWRNALKVLGLR
jgi:hypothetical protein